ncbi:MAG: acyloxyacyl hydrolase, partial [Chlamydiae bacterium]|nr:acyloxyacyl hydrolase [Chlamydiota bacterium]
HINMEGGLRFLFYLLGIGLPMILQAREPSRAKLLYLGTGIYDIIHDPHNALLQLEYRTFFPKCHYLRPLAGTMITNKASWYIYGGIAGDIFLSKQWVLTPSFSPGIYLQGKGKDLHFPLEFRSSLELAFIFPNEARLGAQFYHISNASLGKKNPGAEALVFFYGVPL